MAILISVFGKIRQFFSPYVLAIGSISSWSYATENSVYFMPLVYFIILGCVALIAYFCWQSYRQEIHEEKLQENAAAKDERYSTFNLTWINKLINWAYMSSSNEVPEVLKKWLEDINLTLAKAENPIKILVYGIREGSIPPWITDVGQPVKRFDHIEVPLLVQADEFTFTVSVQEEDNGRVIASTYDVITTEFQCWYTLYMSRIEGQGFLAKLIQKTDAPMKIANFRMKQLSEKKISTTVPEVVLDMITKGILDTPLYLNVSTWGPVMPRTEKKKSPSVQKKQKKSLDETSPPTSQRKKKSRKSQGDADSNTESLKKQSTTAKEPAASAENHELQEVKDEDASNQASNTMPKSSKNVLSDRLLANGHGLSGSLGSLVGIKRTPSGRGPAKPIRSREKRILMKVIETSGLTSEGSLFCRGTLDCPQQKSETQPIEVAANPAWPEDELTFDLSSRSSEVKLVFYQVDTTKQAVEFAVGSAVLHLDSIDIDKPSKVALPLHTTSKGNAEVILQLDFTENPVDPTSQRFASPRRSLDLSYMSDQGTENKTRRSKSFGSALSSHSTDNMSSNFENRSPSTTVRTVTVKKLRRSSRGPQSQSTPIMKQSTVESDTATVEGSVAETAMRDLVQKAEIAKLSPESRNQIKKGKTNLNSSTLPEDAQDISVVEPTLSSESKVQATETKNGDTYYSTEDLRTRSSSAAVSITLDEVKSPEDKDAESNSLSAEQEQNNGTKKTRRKKERRPKSLVSGIKPEDMPKSDSDDRDWPKVRRSRSLVFGKGKKRQYNTGSATDLRKAATSKEENDDDTSLSVPENELQKHNKKKKSKSISKLFSKLGRKPSQRRSKAPSEMDASDENRSQTGSLLTPTSGPSASQGKLSPDRRDSYTGSEENSFASADAMTPNSDTLSQNSSIRDGGLKRSKSLRKRLFGGKRKSTKN